MRRTAALIVGGGPAGASAAIGLAQAGLRSLIVERDVETRDTLCGGFLSWRTVERLSALGVDPRALGAATVERLALFAGRHMAEARLPAPAAALSRRALDRALLDRAAAAGAAIERGVTARYVSADGIELADGERIATDRLILATGKHELRGAARPRAHQPTLGLRWRLMVTPTLRRQLAGSIEMHLFAGGYAGLVLQEDGTANLCMAVRQHRLAGAGNQPDMLLAQLAGEVPMLAARLAAAGAVSGFQAIANVPYGWRAQGSDGFYRIGDQAGVIPSLAGEGIAIAIASGMAAADALANGLSAAVFQRRLGRQLGRPLLLAALLWRAAEAPLGAHGLAMLLRRAPWLFDRAARLTRI